MNDREQYKKELELIAITVGPEPLAAMISVAADGFTIHTDEPDNPGVLCCHPGHDPDVKGKGETFNAALINSLLVLYDKASAPSANGNGGNGASH